MLIQKEFKIEDDSWYRTLDAQTLCFDIETTGLNKRYSHLTVIGTGFVKDGVIVFKQWLLDNPAREKEMLAEFSAYLKQFGSLLHFNGGSFDIPYVRERCALYQLPDPFAGVRSVDLYRSARRLKGMLKLGRLRQKDVETLFEVRRKDKISGRDCIGAYDCYLKYGDLRARDALLLHNEEDVTGLLKLSGLTAVDGLCRSVSVERSYFDGNDFHAVFSIGEPIPVPLSYGDLKCSLKIHQGQGILRLYGVHCTRKYFFEDYKNYYYLPDDDHAIHKSVGIYVDKAHRQPATKENCYEKQTGLFFCQPEGILSPAFKETCRDKCSWAERKSLENASKEDLSRLCLAYLNAVFDN